MKAFFTLFISSLFLLPSGAKALQDFKGNRSPGILSSPEIATAPSELDLQRVQELHKVHQAVENETGLDSRAGEETRDLPSPEAI